MIIHAVAAGVSRGLTYRVHQFLDVLDPIECLAVKVGGLWRGFVIEEVSLGALDLYGHVTIALRPHVFHTLESLIVWRDALITEGWFRDPDVARRSYEAAVKAAAC